MNSEQMTPRELAIQVVRRIAPYCHDDYRPGSIACPESIDIPWGMDACRWVRAMRERDALLIEFDLKYLGGGKFSVAYESAHHPGRVLKLAFRGDDAWESWANYCMNNPGLHKPRVYEMGSVGQGYKRVAWAWMKKYQPANQEGDIEDIEDIVENWRYSPRWSSIRAVANVASIHGTLDLHDENIMWDPESCTWIITDPVC